MRLDNEERHDGADSHEPADLLRVDVADGKYTFVQRPGGGVEILRYGETWVESHEIRGGNALFAMAHELEELRQFKADALSGKPFSVIVDAEFVEVSPVDQAAFPFGGGPQFERVDDLHPAATIRYNDEVAARLSNRPGLDRSGKGIK